MISYKNYFKRLKKKRRKKWEKIIQKGKFRYLLKNTIIFVISFLITGVIIKEIIGDGLNDWRELLPGLTGGCIGFIIGMNISWERNITNNWIIIF